MKKSIIYFISLFVVLSTIAAAKNSFLKLPEPVDGVSFIANIPNGQIYLGENGISFVAQKELTDYNNSSNDNASKQYELHRINLNFKNAKKPIVSTSDLTSDREYFIHNNRTIELFQTNEIYFSNIYNGIDFRAYFTSNDEFEFDFVIHPNADPNSIKLAISHQKSIQLNESGEINLEFEFDKLEVNKPFSYQTIDKEISEISSSFVLSNNILSFNIGDYDKTKKLTIDPITRFMGSYFGGNGNDVSYDIDEDSQGNYYITGYTQSPFNIASNGYQLVIGGLEDAFLAKFDRDNKRIWSTYFGGTDYESANGLTIDPLGNIIIVGETRSPSGIATQNAHQNVYGGGGSDGFIAKFTPTGLLEWATYYGGDQIDLLNEVDTDNSGNICVVGNTSSDNNIFENGYQFGRNGLSEAFVVKFTSLGVRQWGTYYGGTQEESGNDITIDPNNNIYIVGTTNSPDNISYLGSNPNLAGDTDAFVTSFKGNGDIRWSTYYGGTLSDIGKSIHSDSQYLYFGGSTQSNNGIAFNGYQNSLAGSYDGFLVKFDFIQSGYWGTYFGGNGSDFLNGIYSTGTSVYTVGSTNSNSGISFLGWQMSFGGGSSDGYLNKYLSSGIMEWSTYYGGSNTDVLDGISNSNKLFIAGNTNSNNNISQDGFQNDYTGQLDAMFAEMSESELSLILTEEKYCSGKEYLINIDFINLTFDNNNEFIVELSDYQGSFSNPEIVGRKTSNSKTQLTIKLPELQEYSRNYQLRLKSTSPQYNGNTSLDSITIFPEPKINNSSAPLCVGETMIFSTTDLPEVTYNWTFEEGIKTDSSQVSNKVYWENAGEFKVTLISENPVCKDTTTKTVKVSDLPIAEFVGDTIVCEFSNISYNTTSKADIKYTWDAEGGTIISSSDEGEAVINWTQSGDGKVILIARDTITNCETTITQDIRILESPGANISGIDTTCSECTESLSTDDSGVSEWKIQNGNIISQSNIGLTFKPIANVDSVIVTLIKTNNSGKCSDTATKIVYITNSPKANISGNIVVCEQEDYIYSTSSDPTLINNWTIIGGEEVSETLNTITIKWFKIGEGEIKLVQQSKENSYKDSTSLDITIHPKPKDNQVLSNKIVCQYDSLSLSVSHSGEETVKYLLDSEPIGTNGYHTFFELGFKNIVFEVSNKFDCKFIDSFLVEVVLQPEAPKITLNGSAIFGDKNGAYTWYRNGERISGEQGTSIELTEEGRYTATYFQDGLPCESALSNEIVYNITDVEEFIQSGIAIYPNPAEDYIQIKSELIISDLSIVDLLGNEIFKTTNIINTEIDISVLNAGIYFVKLRVNDKLLTKKIIIK